MRRTLVIRLIIYTIAAVILAWALYLAWQRWQAQTTGDAIPPKTTISHSTDKPSERTPPPIATSDYQVAPERPRAIAIPRLNVQGFIQPVGIDRQQHMAVPTNVQFAGWYTRSALPGQPGLSIINGHVSGRYTSGIFKRLQELKAGDQIRIQRGDLSWLTYRVTANTLFAANDPDILYKPSDNTVSELHLVTCGGKYNTVNRSYDQRVLIRGTLLTD